MSKIKIAHVLHSVGGVDVYVRFVLDNIDNSKFCSVILHGKHDTNHPFLDKDKEPVKEYRPSIVRDISFIRDLKAIFEIYKILKKERPNIIHAHSAKGGIMGRVVGRLLNIKVIKENKWRSLLCFFKNLLVNFYVSIYYFRQFMSELIHR